MTKLQHKYYYNYVNKIWKSTRNKKFKVDNVVMDKIKVQKKINIVRIQEFNCNKDPTRYHLACVCIQIIHNNKSKLYADTKLGYS